MTSNHAHRVALVLMLVFLACDGVLGQARPFVAPQEGPSAFQFLPVDLQQAISSHPDEAMAKLERLATLVGNPVTDLVGERVAARPEFARVLFSKLNPTLLEKVGSVLARLATPATPAAAAVAGERAGAQVLISDEPVFTPKVPQLLPAASMPMGPCTSDKASVHMLALVVQNVLCFFMMGAWIASMVIVAIKAHGSLTEMDKILIVVGTVLWIRPALVLRPAAHTSPYG